MTALNAIAKAPELTTPPLTTPAPNRLAALSPAASPAAGDGPGTSQQAPSLREVFDDFVGQSFYGQMLSAMRKTVGTPAYFHGGRMEEVFQAQLDQLLGEKLADATADQFSGPMFDLFTLNRKM